MIELFSLSMVCIWVALVNIICCLPSPNISYYIICPTCNHKDTLIFMPNVLGVVNAYFNPMLYLLCLTEQYKNMGLDFYICVLKLATIPV